MAMDLFAQKVKKQNKARKRRLIGSFLGTRIKPSLASESYLRRYVALNDLHEGLVSTTKEIRSIGSRIRRMGSQDRQKEAVEASGLRRNLAFWQSLHSRILSEIKRVAGKKQA